MLQYVVQRLLLGILTTFLVSLLVFALLRVAPSGDVVDMILSAEGGGQMHTPESIRQLREKLGLTRPLPVQYLVFMRDFFTLHWGNALFDERSIMGEIKARLPITLQLSLMTVTISFLLAIPVGTIMALKQDTWIDYVLRVFSLGGLSVPNFWTGTLIILGGTIYFNWSPRLEYVSPFEDPRGNFVMFFWPAFALGWVSQATEARMLRSAMLEVLHQDYIRTANAKGLRYFTVVYRHALKNAFIPVITLIGLSVAITVGGAVIIETLFSLPGMGRYLVTALSRRDYPVVQTLALFLSMWVVLANLLVDLSYGWLDPRIRYE